MRVTQGAFSFLPDLTDEEIVKQIEYCLGKDLSINVEYSDDPHPRNIFWKCGICRCSTSKTQRQ